MCQGTVNSAVHGAERGIPQRPSSLKRASLTTVRCLEEAALPAEVAGVFVCVCVYVSMGMHGWSSQLLSLPGSYHETELSFLESVWGTCMPWWSAEQAGQVLPELKEGRCSVQKACQLIFFILPSGFQL